MFYFINQYQYSGTLIAAQNIDFYKIKNEFN